MVHLPIALCAFQKNTPHPHRGPQKHPLPEVTAWIRQWSSRLAGTWWMKPVLEKLLLQSPRAVIQTLTYPLLVCWFVHVTELLGETTHPVHFWRPQWWSVKCSLWSSLLLFDVCRWLSSRCCGSYCWWIHTWSVLVWKTNQTMMIINVVKQSNCTPHFCTTLDTTFLDMLVW